MDNSARQYEAVACTAKKLAVRRVHLRVMAWCTRSRISCSASSLTSVACRGKGRGGAR